MGGDRASGDHTVADSSMTAAQEYSSRRDGWRIRFSGFRRRPRRSPRGAPAVFGRPVRRPASFAGRISYALGMTGPSVATVDTACSSSSGRDASRMQRAESGGTCDVVLAGGVMLILSHCVLNLRIEAKLAQSGR